VLGIIFAIGLLVVPAVLLGAAAGLSVHLTDSRQGLGAWAVRYAYTMAPLGFGIWIAHYAFHFLTGFWTFIPVIQGALADVGFSLLGSPRWDLGPLVPSSWLLPLEQLVIGIGWLASLRLAYRYASKDVPDNPWRAFLPWAILLLLLFLAANWLMGQPMEMRGTMLG
jgi:hypothetical protein